MFGSCFSGKPDPCPKIEVLEITKNSATIGWVKPMRDGGAKIDGYVIEYIEVKPPPEPPAPVEVCHVINKILTKCSTSLSQL